MSTTPEQAAAMVPSEPEVAARLGDKFLKEVNDQIAKQDRSRNVQQVIAIGHRLIALYDAAALLGHIDVALANGYCESFVDMTRARLTALGVRLSPRNQTLPNAEVH